MRQKSILKYERVVVTAAGSSEVHNQPQTRPGEDSEIDLCSEHVVDFIPAKTLQSHEEILPDVQQVKMEAFDEVIDCFICLNAKADAVLIECGHGGICSGIDILILIVFISYSPFRNPS